MKHIFDISNSLKKLLVIIFAVLALSACGNDYMKGEKCISEEDCRQCEAEGKACNDVSDAFCLGCIILEQIYDAVGDNVMKLHVEFSRASMAIVMIGFSIWLAMRLLKFVSSMTEANVGEVWNEILRKAFICLFCGILASNPTNLVYAINTLIIPFYMAFLDLGIQVLNNSLASDTGEATEVVAFAKTITVKTNALRCELSGSANVSIEEGFPNSIRETMSCIIRALKEYLTMGGEISFKILSTPTGGLGFLGALMGIITYLCFWVVKIGFVFYLVDTIFQMGIIILMLPIFILSYAFGPTRKWATMGLKHTLMSAAFLMSFSIIVAMVLSAMISLVRENQDIFNPADTEGAFKDISIGFLCMLLIGFLVFGSMGVSQQLTSAVIGAKMSANFQKNLKAVVQMSVELLLRAVGSLITSGSSETPVSKFKLIRRVLDAYKKTTKKLEKLAGRSK